ncbi:DUF481 domain-containing protein [bacterium]|nr:DUF481 domain-containing protein [bacterium]
MIDHPQLGRLELTADKLNPPQPKPLWKSSVSAGLVGNEKDGDSSLTFNFTGNTRYEDEDQKLSMNGSFNSKQSKKSGEPRKFETEKGSAQIRYDKPIASKLGLFAQTDYKYIGTNSVGVNTVDQTLGVAYPLIQTETVEFIMSVGPTAKWKSGGKGCSSDSDCGNTYGGGSIIANLLWKPFPSLEFELKNMYTSIFATEVKPSNNFSADIRYYPVKNSKLFTTLRYQAVFDSMSTPEVNNSITAQVGTEF